ncbi:MAG: glycoside hydrolase domain-containing protein [Mangrovibacterium sp.]
MNLNSALFFWATSLKSQKPVSDYVDLFISTAGDHGQLDPSATVPFGMVKLGPDTEPGNHSGYDYHANKIRGFSHNRISGTGCDGAGGNLRILPKTGWMNDYSAPVIKSTEKAFPGYYSVTFQNKILAELTATNQTGFHRYTFPGSDSAYVLVDTRSSFGGTIAASTNMLNKYEFFVQVSAKNVCGVGRYISNYHVWCNKELTNHSEQDGKIFFRFKTRPGEEVIFKVTTSTISLEDARDEWLQETKELSFDEVRKTSLKKWEDLLSKITVEGKEEYKSIFYTHLYHVFLNPVKSENRLKYFRATNGEVYKSDGYTHYDCWSMWDNFRNKFSLYALIIPETASDIANSLVDLYKYGKPYWSGFQEPVPTVRTEHSVITLLDFYRRGITGFDVRPVYQKLSAEISNAENNTPDKKLEHSYDLWALAQFAQILDKEDDYQFYMNEALKYKQTWKNKFLKIDERSDIMHGDGLYEGTIWQYRWHVQFDVDGMIDMIGGKEKYTEQLEYFFNHNLYNHGNQPDIHVPFMFNFSSKPWLTQKWVNQILTKDMIQNYGTHRKWETPYVGRIYKKAPEGYIPEMDDDEGTMSGWYVLASMGLYPVLVGEPVFQLSTPIFDKITFHLSRETNFTIIVNGLSDQSFYINSAELNGNPFNQTFIKHEDIVPGGTLTLNVTSKPNVKFGR